MPDANPLETTLALLDLLEAIRDEAATAYEETGTDSFLAIGTWADEALATVTGERQWVRTTRKEGG